VSRAGADTGGTFTDFVVEAGGQLLARKVPSTPGDPAAALLEAGDGLVFDSLAHSTTVATNALLERSAPAAALLTTAGFEDVLELGRQARPELYALNPTKPEPLIPALLRFGVAERVGPDGVVEVALNDDEVARVVDTVLASGVASVAVCLLHAWLYPAHEKRLGAALRARGILVSLSSETVPLPGEYERTSTTAIDAYVKPVMAPYLARLSSLPAVSVLSSAGGAISTAEAAARPCLTVLSGPAAGVAGACAIGASAGVADFLSFDMGGTSTDVALMEGGRAALHDEGAIAGLPIAVPMIAVHTVGAGGGSIAHTDAGGALLVGPESAGAVPGPASYGHGGQRATITDAHVALGRLPHGLLGGALRLDAAAARRALSALGVGAPIVAAEALLNVVSAQMARALRTVSVARGRDPAMLALVAFGGAGPMHAVAVARELGVRRVLVPSQPGLLCAWGALVAPPSCELTHALGRRVEGSFAADQLAGEVALLEEEARKRLSAFAVEMEPRVAARSLGQSSTIDVGLDGDLVAGFHAAHRRRYGFALEDRPVELIALRLSARRSHAAPPSLRVQAPGPARQPDAAVVFSGRRRPTAVYLRARLPTEAPIPGPALLLEYSSTTVLPPGASALVLPDGTLDITP
jgi:N-methylhydantoinase A